jgi:aspartate-semialdehyde dehydrogenase
MLEKEMKRIMGKKQNIKLHWAVTQIPVGNLLAL